VGQLNSPVHHMRIVIRSSDELGGWNLIELQGELFVPEGSYDGKEIGKLSERDGVPILVLGNHFLEGKRVALKKPFAIIMKKDQPEHAPIDQEAEKHGTTCADYSMVGVIRYKYLFKNRPKPLQ
jgi:chromosome transmission fidelity protein 8